VSFLDTLMIVVYTPPSVLLRIRCYMGAHLFKLPVRTTTATQMLPGTRHYCSSHAPAHVTTAPQCSLAHVTTAPQMFPGTRRNCSLNTPRCASKQLLAQ